MLTAKSYSISILNSWTVMPNYQTRQDLGVTMEHFHTVFPPPMVASAIAPLSEGDWNERRAKYGLPPLRQHPRSHGEAGAASQPAVSEAAISEAAVSEAAISEATDRALSFLFPESPLPLEIPVIPELRKP